jgi:hypothetical protein
VRRRTALDWDAAILCIIYEMGIIMAALASLAQKTDRFLTGRFFGAQHFDRSLLSSWRRLI